MGRAEEFIQEHTKNCSNLAHLGDLNGNVWEENTPWLTLDQARKAVEITREEVIEWIDSHWREYVWLADNNIIHFGHWKNDLKQAIAESKDERIRKELLNYLYDAHDDDEERARWIAWLEAQGVKVSAIEGFETEFERQVSGLIASAINKEHEYNQGYVKWTANALLNYAKHEIEKQGEQKPKFRVGDTIKKKGTGDIVTVSEVDLKNREYMLSNTGFIPFKYEYLWELVEQKSADKVEPKFKVKYADNEYNVLEVKDVAGVTFYGIEDKPNHIDYVQAENCERVGGYSIKEYGSPYPTEPAVFSEQKIAWSEEDVAMLDSAIAFVEHSPFTTIGKCKSSVIAWLKSLKPQNGS